MITSKSLDDFWAWLKSDSSEQFTLENAKSGKTIAFAHIQANDKFKYLLLVQEPNSIECGKGKEFIRCVGIYCRQDNRLYVMPCDVRHFIMDCDENVSGIIDESGYSAHGMQAQIAQTVVDLIAGDRTRFGIDQAKPAAKKFNQNNIVRDAANLFLKNEGILTAIPLPRPDDDVNIEGLTMQDWFSYMADKQTYLNQKAMEYISSHKESLHSQFQYMDLVWEVYQKIASDPTNQWNIIKQIMSVVEKSQAKTVNVYIQKNDLNGSKVSKAFKVQAQAFHLSDNYGAHPPLFDLHQYISNPLEYREFTDLFGCGMTDLCSADEIVRITYGKKALYERRQTI